MIWYIQSLAKEFNILWKSSRGLKRGVIYSTLKMQNTFCYDTNNMKDQKTVVQSSNTVVQASDHVEETPGLNASSGD